MKKIITLVLVLLVLLSVFSTVVSAEEKVGGYCNVYVTVDRNNTIKYNSADTYELSFVVQSDSIRLKGPQGCCFAVDLSVFDLIDKKGNLLTEDLSATYSNVGNKVVYFVADSENIRWNGAAFYAVSTDGKAAYISLQPYQLDGEQDISAETKLESVLVGLKAGKSEADIDESSVRLITVEEARQLCQDVIILFDGENIYACGSIAAGRDNSTIKTGVRWDFPLTQSDDPGGGAVYEVIYDYTAEEEWRNPFSDISETDKYYDAVRFVYENNLFIGVSATEFAPHKTMTRAMFVTVLGRLAGVDQTKYSGTSFSDAKAGEWYSAYVEWAAENGIVNGYGNGRFGVNDEVTVEQAAAIIARYARFTGIDTTDAVLADYIDIADISDWARADLAWLTSTGIYAPDDGKLSPKAKAERQLVATMMYGYVSATREE